MGPKKREKKQRGREKKGPLRGRGGGVGGYRLKRVTSAAPLSPGPRTVLIVPPYPSPPIHTEMYSWIHCFLHCLYQPVD